MQHINISISLIWSNSFAISLAELAVLDSCFCSLQSPACLLGSRMSWGQSPLCRAPGHRPGAPVPLGAKGMGKAQGTVLGWGICPSGPPLQEEDPPCNHKGLMSKSTKAFSKQIHFLWKTRKQKSICMSSLWQVLIRGKGEWADALHSWFLTAFQCLCVLINTYLCPLTFFLMSVGETSSQGIYCVISLDEGE